MKKVLLVALLISCSGCQYFSYQEGCTDDQDRPGCDGSHPVEGHRK